MATPAQDNAISLSTPVSKIAGVGKRRAQAFRRLGIVTISDLLKHLPARYEFENAEDSIANLPLDAIGSVRGTITTCRWVPSYGGKVKGRFEAVLRDQTTNMQLVWFNAGYLREQIHPGLVMRVQGKAQNYNGYRQMVNPAWEVLEKPDHTPAKRDKLRPIYPATEDLSSRIIEQVIHVVLEEAVALVSDPLPQKMLTHHNMPSLQDAFRMIHRPQHEEEASNARRRLAFNELLLLQLGIALKRKYTQDVLTATPLHWSEAIDAHIRARFPFELTESQKSVIAELIHDLQRDHPMNRLLQGDVGSGKTVVALYAMLMAVADRKQAALMVPTELLAEQHCLSISSMLEGSNVRVALLTGNRSRKTAERSQLRRSIEQGDIDIIIGTQALLTDSLRFKELAVVVIDEQHRFGVEQRARLRSHGGTDAHDHCVPHCLVMTATPIPRTLSLTVFGDLDVSIIKGLPPGRQPIVTRVVGPDKADDVYHYMAKRIDRGEQAYIVVPAIEGNETDSRVMLKNIRDHEKLIRQRYCSKCTVAAVHGRLKREEREAIMRAFRKGDVQVLIATTVIEVGVDVPNASVMIVEHAERFGLAQLHQLRGRVGRGRGAQALCVFIADPTTDDAQQRMAAIAATADGFAVAESDLAIRGMGEFFGTRQSGAPPLRIADIPKDMDLLQLARRDAHQIVQNDPTLQSEAYAQLKRILLQQYGEAIGLIDVG